MSEQTLIKGDCLEVLEKMDKGEVDIVVTSPPYNLNINYKTYQDNKTNEEYLDWIDDLSIQIKRVLSLQGHFFLNVGYTNQNPWVAFDVANVVRKHFILQNTITWVKHIKIDRDTYGIYKPISSDRYLSPTNEFIFHFTKTGNVKLDRISIVGEYNPKSGKYASAYTESASLNRWEADLKRRTAKQLGSEDWRLCEHTQEFKDILQSKKDKKPFEWNAPKDEGNTWYIPYVPIAKLAKESGSADRGTLDTGRGGHPATFPPDLPKQCIKLTGLTSGLVLDPFIGTGSTLIACKDLGIDGIGIDIDQHYIDFSQNRLNNWNPIIVE